MTSERFFFVFRNNGRLSPAIYEDEPPTPQMLKGMSVIYKRRLEGRWLAMPLTDIMAEYRARFAAGTLPPSNMTPPPKEKQKPAKPLYEITHSKGEFWKKFHESRRH